MHISVDKEIKSFLSLLNENNSQAYFYGSSLVNAILNQKNTYCVFDIITTTPADVLQNILIRAGYKLRRYEEYISSYKDNNTFLISFVFDLDEYFKNVDFTLNSVIADMDGHIIEKYNGLDNIKLKTIRCAKNNDEYLNKNKIKKLKAVRLLSHLESFAIDSGSIEYIKSNPSLEGTDKHLIASEINLLLLGTNVKKAICTLHATSLLKNIFPQLDMCAGVSQHEFHTKDVFNHIVDVVGNTQNDLLLRLAALFHDIAKPECKVTDNGKIRFYGHDIASAELSADILKSFGYEKDMIKKVYLLIKYHMKKHKLSDEELLEMIYDCKQAGLDIDYIFKLQLADNAATLVTDRSGMYYNQNRVKALINSASKEDQ